MLKVLPLLMLICCFGCRERSTTQKGLDRFVPSADAGNAALRAALEDWKAGNPAGGVKTHTVQVQVIDTHRRKDQKLTSFEILGEVPGEAARCLAARVVLSHPDGEEKVRYVVVGIDPLWVIRHEDYEMIGHWDHAMPSAPDKAGPPEKSVPPDQPADDTAAKQDAGSTEARAGLVESPAPDAQRQESVP